MNSTNIYQDIATRTGGDIYIGVVGPVRTGKSTFIKCFMDRMVIPNIDNVYLRERAKDELPQSGSGKTIMTAEPKFVPEEAVRITIEGKTSFQVRLIDCVGFMVPGAIGQFEGESPRMVSTPWFENQVPLAQAAEIGTRKVIREHSTIGLVITTDGTVGEIPRADYVEAEERIVRELQEINKPFCILLNTKDPFAPEAEELRRQLEEKYQVSCIAVNCMELEKTDIEDILTTVLHEFPVKEYSFTLPNWVTNLTGETAIRDAIYQQILAACGGIRHIRETEDRIKLLQDCEYVEGAEITGIDLGAGTVDISVRVPQSYLYQLLSRECGETITNEAQLLPLLTQLTEIKREYDRLAGALEQVQQTGYGIVMPTVDQLRFEEPEIVRSGGKYGVKLRASAPSIHLIRADIETEIAPVVGSEKQSEDLVHYLLSEFEDNPKEIWKSNIFGKSLSDLVNEGLNNKLYRMPDSARCKLQETLQRIINEGSGGLICIIL